MVMIGDRGRFTSKERDSETGLDYFGARYFSAAQGRFTSPDWSQTPQAIPYADLRNPQTFNLYVYVGNNPLSFTDSDGHALDCSGDKAQGVGCQYLAQWNADHGIDPAKNATSAEVQLLAGKNYGTSVTYTYANGSKVTLSGVFAFIDNNPGNAIAGNGVLGKNGPFVIFPSAQAGWDALANNLSRHAAAGDDVLTTMQSYAPKPPPGNNNPLLDGNDPEKYAKALAASIGVQTTTKLSDLTPKQFNSLVVTIGRIEGYFGDAKNPSKSITAPTRQE